MGTNLGLWLRIALIAFGAFLVSPSTGIGAGAAPNAASANLSTPLNTALAVSLNANDIDSQTLTFAIVTPPTHGTLGAITGVSCMAPGKSLFGVTCTGSVLYTPVAGYSGPDSFTYKANDGASDSNIATVTITVAPPATCAQSLINKSIVPTCGGGPAPSQAPVAASKAVSTAQSTPAIVTLSAADGDSGAVTFAIVTGPAHGALGGLSAASCAPSGLGSNCTATVTYTPTTGYTGTDSFTYKANDGALDSATATVTITVTAGTPTAAPVSNSLNVGTTANTPKVVMLTASDADSGGLSFSIVFTPANGALGPVGAPVCTPASAGSNCTASVTYTPNAGYTGGDSFSFKTNVTVNEVRSHGDELGSRRQWRGMTYLVDVLPKSRVEVVVQDQLLDRVICVIREHASTGGIGDGTIAVVPVEDLIDVHSGVHLSGIVRAVV